MKTNLSREQKVALLNEISSAHDTKWEVALESVTWGTKVEVWNLVACWIQNAESDKNDIIAHVECALCDESAEIGKYFRALGFNF